MDEVFRDTSGRFVKGNPGGPGRPRRDSKSPQEQLTRLIHLTGVWCREREAREAAAREAQSENEQ
jgi:hypothetical protein